MSNEPIVISEGTPQGPSQDDEGNSITVWVNLFNVSEVCFNSSYSFHSSAVFSGEGKGKDKARRQCW